MVLSRWVEVGRAASVELCPTKLQAEAPTPNLMVSEFGDTIFSWLQVKLRLLL